jgi:hypothetical protein
MMLENLEIKRRPENNQDKPIRRRKHPVVPRRK